MAMYIDIFRIYIHLTGKSSVGAYFYHQQQWPQYMSILKQINRFV